MRKESFYETLFKENCKPDAVFIGMVFSVSASAFAAENETTANIVPIESIKEHSNPENYEKVSSGYLKIHSDGSVSITDKYKNYVETKLSENGVYAAISVNDNTITIIDNSHLPYAKGANSAKSADSGAIVWSEGRGG
jgi:hypothetical protein